MTDVLILGGTGWLSSRIAERWRDAGARVTCLARGGRPAPDGTALVRGDRDDDGVYDQLQRDWDEVVDVSSRAGHVERAVGALAGRARRWTYVSSMSVYADDSTPDADEPSPLHAPAREGDEDDYAAQKVAAEQAVGSLGDRARILRPGLIVGPGDPSDRFGYWAAAFERAGAEAVLVPPLAEAWAQVIDVEDLAAFIATDRGHGILNAIGEPLPLGEMLALVRAATRHSGEVVEAGEAWLADHEVDYWMGERSLPLWLPAEMSGFLRRSNRAYLAEGAALTPLEDTIAKVVADERARGVDRPRRAGLTRDEEEALLRELRG
ncbi:NAD-dependent epimerase/dehydratase family protein [Microbacterium sp. CIAB417]|uniref:NAD-dependent epimerase/dehydratase family protein n=1 Tax=Microbacterium sp. CIAB417 TaxID=2860287 RepID=UPI001FAE6C02|nr:NAD-dependent epimerase/dehydratase family protein [Microbacterium sp. CIAB417]